MCKEIAITKHKCSQKFPRKKSKSHRQQEIKNYKKIKEKMFKKKFEKKNNKWKSKAKFGWDWRAIRKFKKCKINESQRKKHGQVGGGIR